jgi:hypothetical protein
MRKICRGWNCINEIIIHDGGYTVCKDYASHQFKDMLNGEPSLLNAIEGAKKVAAEERGCQLAAELLQAQEEIANLCRDMAVADSNLNCAYNEIDDLQEWVYDYEEASNKHHKAKGKQKAVEPRKHTHTDAYNTDDDPLSW